jgi:hypothetical protein
MAILLDPHQKGPDASQPEAQWPPQWMLDLERALDRVRHAVKLLESAAKSGPVDLRPGARALERVHAAMFDAYEERAIRVDAVRSAIDALDEAAATLGPAKSADAAVGFAVDYLVDTRAALLEAYERVAPLVPRPPAPAPDLRASTDQPALHLLDRPSLVPQLRVPDPAPPEVEETPTVIARPKTFEELERAVKELKERSAPKKRPAPPEEEKAAPKPDPPLGFAEDVGRAVGESEFVRRRTRECFEDVSMIGVQRAPILGEPWRGARILERRMLASIDAIAAMGPGALGTLESLFFDSPLKDPPRLFALTMILGCIGGRDALATAERAFLACEQDDPQHAPHFAAALKLVPHPHLSVALRTLLADGDPAHAALAIDVLAYRGMATPDEIARAVTAEPEIAAAALPWQAFTAPTLARETIDAVLESPHEGLRRAATLSMVLSGHTRTISTLRDALSGEDEEAAERAAWLLPAVGGLRDAEILLERAHTSPTRPVVTALGWIGSPLAVAPLIKLLEHDDEVVAVAAAYALDRITHAGLWEDAVVDPEDIVAPDVPEPDIELGEPRPQPLARLVSDPRDMPAQPAPETINRPTTRVDPWRAYWAKHGDAYDAKLRYRRGQPYTPLVSWRELDQFPCTPGERRLLQWELVARSGGYTRFDPHDFVPVQEAAIPQWEPLAKRASGEPGSWSLPARR